MNNSKTLIWKDNLCRIWCIFFLIFLAESSHDYYIKIVPTVYEDLWGNQNISYQYTFAYKVRVLIIL